tara:strand:+ start:732 stop:1178 length:447 start_codon:yes stop_codon:yes gene_type:complete
MKLWILLSFLVTITTSFRIVAYKYLSNTNYDNITILLFSFVLMGIISLLLLLYNKKNYSKNDLINILTNKKSIIFITVFSIISLSNVVILQTAIKLTPNISYTHAIINLNIILVLLGSCLFFNEKINYKTLLGIILSLIGVLLITLNS